MTSSFVRRRRPTAPAASGRAGSPASAGSPPRSPRSTAGHVDRRPLAPRIEPARVLDLSLDPLHVGVVALGSRCSRRRRLRRICTSRSGSVIRPTISGRVADLEFGRQRHLRHQRHVGRPDAAIGEIDAGRRLGGARCPTRITSASSRSCVDWPSSWARAKCMASMRSKYPRRADAGGPAMLALGMEMHGQHAHHLVEHPTQGSCSCRQPSRTRSRSSGSTRV